MALKTLKEEIKFLLENHPETRDSDEKLYASYLQRHGVRTISVIEFLIHFNDFEVSDFESVTRCRRKIVEENPELAPSDRVKELRAERQLDFLDFARLKGGK